MLTYFSTFLGFIILLLLISYLSDVTWSAWGYALRYSRWRHAPSHVGLRSAVKPEKKKKTEENKKPKKAKKAKKKRRNCRLAIAHTEILSLLSSLRSGTRSKDGDRLREIQFVSAQTRINCVLRPPACHFLSLFRGNRKRSRWLKVKRELEAALA